jgi:hypothetical protein
VRRAAGAKAELGVAGELVRFRARTDGAGERFESTTGGFGPVAAWMPRSGLAIEACVMPLFGDLDGVPIEGWDGRVTLSASSISRQR